MYRSGSWFVLCAVTAGWLAAADSGAQQRPAANGVPGSAATRGADSSKARPAAPLPAAKPTAPLPAAKPAAPLPAARPAAEPQRPAPAPAPDEPPPSAAKKPGPPPPLAAGEAAEPELPPQRVLMPGLYLFQTRTRDGTCNDAPRTGYITSAVATLDGVPGARTMTMQLLNSKYWPIWQLTIGAHNEIVGTANMLGAKDDSKGGSRFEMRAKKNRFQGVGARTYPAQIAGQPTRCTLNYDVLLKPLD